MLALRLNAVHVRFNAKWYSVVKVLSVHPSLASQCRQSIRQYSERQKPLPAVAESKDDSGSEITTEVLTVKEATKTVFNTGIILCGLGLTATLLGYVLYDMFSSNSFNNIYQKALSRCKDNAKVQDILGQPVMGYGEVTGQRRRNYSYQEFQRDGEDFALLQFYLKGYRRRGTIYMELKKNEKRNYETEVVVLLPEFSRSPIIIEDFRSSQTPENVSAAILESMEL